MRGFRKLVMVGVLLVTLLLVIDTIDAGRKQGKKKELETGKSYEQENSKFTSKNKHTESVRYDKLKKSGLGRTEDYEEENQYVSKESRFDSKKPDLKRNIKFTSKEKKITENEKSKTSKHFQKFKKSKVTEKEAIERIDSSKAKVKKSKPQYLRSENVDKIVKTVKKTSQKKLFEENEDVEKMLHEELGKLQNEETISVEESVGGNSKKRKYKLVEVVLEEDGQDEDQEGNGTTSELGSEDQEFVSVESEEKSRSTQNPKQYKNKKSSKKYNTVDQEQDDESASEDNYFNNTEETSEQEFTERMPSEVDSFSGRYVDPVAESCHRLPEDPNRQGPKKLTLYVVEEEIDGQIRKRVVSEEDGVTMCEVADLLKETYNMAIPEE